MLKKNDGNSTWAHSLFCFFDVFCRGRSLSSIFHIVFLKIDFNSTLNLPTYYFYKIWNVLMECSIFIAVITIFFIPYKWIIKIQNSKKFFKLISNLKIKYNVNFLIMSLNLFAIMNHLNHCTWKESRDNREKKQQ